MCQEQVPFRPGVLTTSQKRMPCRRRWGDEDGWRRMRWVGGTRKLGLNFNKLNIKQYSNCMGLWNCGACFWRRQPASTTWIPSTPLSQGDCCSEVSFHLSTDNNDSTSVAVVEGCCCCCCYPELRGPSKRTAAVVVVPLAHNTTRKIV